MLTQAVVTAGPAVGGLRLQSRSLGAARHFSHSSSVFGATFPQPDARPAQTGWPRRLTAAAARPSSSSPSHHPLARAKPAWPHQNAAASAAAAAGPAAAPSSPLALPSVACASSNGETARDPLLLRVARGEDAERTPVWLMRQAGRYMADFRKFSDKIPFRQRSETPEIAIELSLQPWRAFGTDGVIMFSDILTILPALGIEFDMVKGKGPVISNPIASTEDVAALRPLDDPSVSLGFVGEILSTLRGELAGTDTALLGFVGSPWTLAAYAIEGHGDKNLVRTKSMMFYEPKLLHSVLSALEDALVTYCCYQIDSGAQIVQIFDSWAHHLSPSQFREFSLPYADRVLLRVRSLRPSVPLIFHANGGTGKLPDIAQSGVAESANVIGIDWGSDMAYARGVFGDGVVLQGNVDPLVLLGPEAAIREAVADCVDRAGERHHILNVGHGVIQGTPEEAVRFFCQLARETGHGSKSSSPLSVATA